ncbi:hypothetical protein SKAU_G00023880 [Synaphobranchus kaupii]|uniref:Uncharacterized protein n=1 Tax=Synaphobranchus kaupii TaxID=118154 RepID=A0A9Q1GDN7_SYNKA|nr:hypothetical protein SKAU_G00023880 [Synaphobranchus kaupii]
MAAGFRLTEFPGGARAKGGSSVTARRPTTTTEMMEMMEMMEAQLQPCHRERRRGQAAARAFLSVKSFINGRANLLTEPLATVTRQPSPGSCCASQSSSQRNKQGRGAERA